VHISVFDIFKIGIGPSSSHTVGPMRAARRFAQRLEQDGQLAQTASVKVELFGSLGFTGKGHGSDKAILLGLEGDEPATVDVDSASGRVARVMETKRIKLLGTHEVAIDLGSQLIFHRREKLPLHSNGMRFTAFAAGGATLVERIFYSVGGGFVVDQSGAPADGSVPAEQVKVPYPFNSADELLKLSVEHGMSVSSLMLENEKALAPEADVKRKINDLAGNGRLREAWLRARGHPAGRAQGQAPGRRTPSQDEERSRRRERSAGDHGLGQPVRARGQRGERSGWSGRHRTDQRRRRHRPGGDHVLPEVPSERR
jgi:L-serine dehydratase